MGLRIILTDAEIAELIEEPKNLLGNWRNRLKLLPREGTAFLHRTLDLDGGNGNKFRVFLRKNTESIEDFSLGLIFIKNGEETILTRYNGSSHRHTNHIERKSGDSNHTFRDQCHIHLCTERYLRSGSKDEGYATVTTAYSTFESAFELFFDSNGFVKPESAQGQQTLF